MRESRKNISNFENEYCTFRPYDWATIDGISRPILYKVVTIDNKSLGLRHNPNIMVFTPGEWVILDENSIVPGKSDWGGIWSALTKSKAKELSKYMKNKKSIDTNIFLTAIYEPLFANSYRVKSGGVMLLENL